MHQEIISAQNPRVKRWSSLLEKKGRTEHGLFLLEGAHLVQEALRANISLETLLYTAERGIPAELDEWANDPRWLRLSQAVYDKCCDVKTPQSVLAVAHIPAYGDVFPFSETQTTRRELVVAVDAVQDPGNIGTIIRSAAAVGATGVVLGEGCADQYAPKTVRATMGAFFRMPVVSGDLQVFVAQARRKGANVITTQLLAERTMYEMDWSQDTWLIVGNEGAGVSGEVAQLASHTVRIPMASGVESLNVAMAASVLLYEAFRQRL